MPKRKFPGLKPNDVGGSDPQFGNIETLPKGRMRQSSVIRLKTPNKNGHEWSRLTFNFPECLGIKETLDNAAKKTQCIPTLDMDVNINIPVVEEVHFDLIERAAPYYMDATIGGDYLNQTNLPNELVCILTGDDQLLKSVPQMSDQTKSVDLSTLTDYQRALASNCIWARIEEPTRVVENISLPSAINPDTSQKGFVYGKTVGGVEGLDYAQVGMSIIKKGDVDNQKYWTSYINNIPPRGYKLLKDHVNLFVKISAPVTHDIPDYYEFNLAIDYTTASVPLSSLLVWQQQLTEFIPKEIQWRGEVVLPGVGNKNGYQILISRGTVKETGEGANPSDATAFPPIEN